MTVNQDIRVIVPKEKISGQWLLGCLLGKSVDLLRRYGKVGTTVESVNFAEIQTMVLAMPVREEQTQIGTFFRKIDELITLHQRKLDHLKLQKKALLQQMFV